MTDNCDELANWEEIKTEYITTNSSYRDLAKKYGVHLNTLGARGKAEGWVELRKQHRDSIVTKALTKDADAKADRLVRFQSIAEKLMGKLDQAVDELDCTIAEKKVTVKAENLETVTKFVTIKPDKTAPVDRLGARHVAAAMRDLKEIMMIRSEDEEEEQHLKNQRLKKIVDEGGDVVTHVILEGDMDEFSL